MSLTKFGKKLLCFLAFFALVFAVVSCTPTQTEAQKAKEEAIEVVETASTKILWDQSAMIDITNDLVLHTKVGDVTVEWASTHPDIINTKGQVILPGGNHEDATLIDSSDESKGKHVAVTLTATFSKEYSYLENGEEVKNVVRHVKEYKFTVLCFTGVKGTIAEMKAAAYNYIYEEMGVEKSISVSNSNVVYLAGVTGVVTAKLNADGSGQFMIHDGTEGIYVYSAADVNVGDVVEVTGNMYSYYGNLQFGSSIKVTVLEGKEMAKPAYEEITVQEWEDAVKDGQKIGYHGGQLLAITAKLEKASEANVAKDWYKLVDPFTAEVAWIYYKSYSAEMQAKLDEYVGKYVRITGVTYDRDSRLVKNHLLWDGGIEEAAAPELSDEQKLTQVKAQVNALAGSYVGGVKLAFPAENAEYGATIAWELPENAPYADGKFTLVSEETKFVAKATITVGTATEVVEVEITVKPIETVSVSQVAKLEKGSIVKLAGTVEAVFASKGYFYLRDLTGTILVYVQTSNGITVNGETVTLKAGDKVSFTGETNVFNGCPQIGSVMSYDSYVAGEWKQATAKATTVAEILSFKVESAPYGEYLYAKGVIVADAEGKYFYLAESTAEGAGKISLYNSSLPEEVKALAGTDTEVTLYFYFYGFQKTDYSGDTRVVYVGREGEHTFGDVEEPGKPEDGKITIAEAIEIAMKQEHNTYTAEKYTITGTINDLYNTVYGNMHLLDAMGNDITIYGLYIEGQKYGDYAGTKPVEGEIITVTGILGTYNGKPQMKNADLVIEKPEHVHTACPTCGLCNDPKCDGAADVKCTCGQAQPGEGTVVEVVIKDYAAANGWANGTMYNSMVMDSNVTVTLSATGGSGTYAPNTGKYYTSGNNWRAYQTDKEATLVITVAEGLVISYVVVTYEASNTGVLLNNGVQAASGAAVTVNAASVTFTVGNSGTATNGQARITAIEVGYGKSGSTPELPKHEHVACPTCGLCTAADCDGAADAKCQGHTVTPPTDGKITIAEALEIANKQAHNTYTTEKYTITGTVNDLYNTVYGNMHLLDAQGNDITIYGLYIEGQKYGDYAGTKPVEGDIITVTGILGTYNGKPQMKNADLVIEPATPKHEHVACPTCGLCTAADCDGAADAKCQGHTVTPPTDGTITLAEAIEIANKQAHNTYTTEKYTVTGTVNDLYNTTYGNMHLLDAQGNDLTIYGLYQNGTRYDALTVKPVEGNVITVTGILGTYNGKPQMKNAELVKIEGVEEPKHEHVACPTCGLCTAADCDGAADAKCQGHTVAPVEGTVITTVIKDYAAANAWANGTMYNELVMDSNVTVTMAATGGSGTYAPNTGKYYTSGYEWRCYQSDKEATIVIAVVEGYVIKTVKVTYNVNKDGILLNGSTQVASGTVVEVNGSSITFSVGNTGTATNGQVKVTAIEVVYDKENTPVDPETCEHTGGEATCTVQAVCTRCGTSYGELAEHVDTNLDITCDFEGCTKRILPAADSKVSLFTANHMIVVSLSSSYYVEGVVTEVVDAKNGIFVISDAEGYTLLVRLPKNAAGTAYSAWTDVKVVLGDTIQLYGKPSRNNGTPNTVTAKLEGGVLTVLKHEHSFSEATCTESSVCGCLAVNAGPLGHTDSDSNNFCDRCQFNMLNKVASIAISTDDTTNGVLAEDQTHWTWSNDEFDVIIAKGTSTFTIYKTAKAYMQLKKLNTLSAIAKSDVKVISVSIYVTNATQLGYLKAALAGETFTEDADKLCITVEWNKEEQFVITNNGTSTVYVNKVEVLYGPKGSDQPVLPEVPTHEHVACPTCGLCTAEDCTGTAEEKCAGHVVAEPKEVTYTWVKGSGEISSDSKTLTIDCGDFIITLYQNTSSSKPVNTYAELRFYQGHILTVTAKEGKVITNITFNDIAGKGASTIKFHGDNASLYTGSVSNKVFTISSENGASTIGFESNKQIRFTSITVTLA